MKGKEVNMYQRASAGGGGGLFQEGNITASSSNEDYTINVGFKPKKIFLYKIGTVSNMRNSDIIVYDADIGEYSMILAKSSSDVYGGEGYAIPSTGTNRIKSISNTGFTFRTQYTGTVRYVAVG